MTVKEVDAALKAIWGELLDRAQSPAEDAMVSSYIRALMLQNERTNNK